MKTQARILLFLLTVAGLWLALKPLRLHSRFTFLPVHWQESVDYMDFWFNALAFAVLAFVSWLAFGPDRDSLVTAVARAWMLFVIINSGNVAIEIAQSRIPGRKVDLADVAAGMLGTLVGIGLCSAVRPGARQLRDPKATPKVLFLDQTGQLGGAELMLLDIVAGRTDHSEVLLFQDGVFRAALEKAAVKTTVVHLSEDVSGITKQAGLMSIVSSVPRLLSLVLKVADRVCVFDVVYANTAKALIVGGAAAWLARRPLVFHLHDIVSGDHFSAINRWALITASNLCATAVIANSEATQAAFVAQGGKACRCVVIPNGFDIGTDTVASDDVQAQRLALGLPDDAWIILMAGRLAHWKGQHVLLEALKQVPNAHVVFLGDALFTAEDRAYAQQLRDTAAEPSLVGRVHFAGFHSNTAPFFAMSDVVVHASVCPEPFGRVIVEGMIAEKPVIATRAGGAAEIIKDGHTGLLVNAGDAGCLAKALLRLKSQPEFARLLAESAAREARQTYSLTAVRAQIEDVIMRAARSEMKFDVPRVLTGSDVQEAII